MSSSRVELEAGDIVFREGDPPTTAFLIESGEVEILAGSAEAMIVLGLLRSGDLLGEMAVIDASPRTATARAVTACVLTTIGREQLHERIEGADPIVRSLLRGQLQRYRSALATLRGGDPVVALGEDPPRGTTLIGGAVDKMRLEAELKDTLARRALEVRFQPILEIEQQRVRGFEALIRWQHPERGAISPAEFIRLAEETSLIVPVGLYVFEEVCAALAGLRRAGVDPLPWIAINVSGRQLQEDGLIENVQQIAALNQVPLSAIKIEITESLTLDVERVAALIERCHGMGMQVALDDFGTGFSNLGHLHKLQFDTVKLDQGFVRQMLEAPRCYAIVRAIVRMVKELDADLVAEGVETDEQLAALAKMKCRYAQGWLIGRPGPSAEMAATLARAP
jgi:diguanylate cyclase